jgi:hypothetical protein
VLGVEGNDMISISGEVTSIDTADFTLTVKHRIAIVDGDEVFAKTEKIKYVLQTDNQEGANEEELTAIVLVTRTQEGDLREAPITLSDVEAGDKVTIDYITRNWKTVVKKVTVVR